MKSSSAHLKPEEAQPSPPELLALVEALARVAADQDYDAARLRRSESRDDQSGDLRPL